MVLATDLERTIPTQALHGHVKTVGLQDETYAVAELVKLTQAWCLLKETLQAAARRLRMHSCKGWSPRWVDVPDNQLPREATDLQQLVPMAVGLYSVDLQTAIPAEGGLIPRVIADEGGACVGRGRTDHSQVGAGDAGEPD